VDPSAAVTPLGQFPCFIEFLNVSGVCEAWVADCPLTYHSNYASDKRAVLGTLLLSILAGHHHYAHITAFHHGGIHPAVNIRCRKSFNWRAHATSTPSAYR
jgi:hypothetical protein